MLHRIPLIFTLVLSLTLLLRPDAATAACGNLFNDVRAEVASLLETRAWYGGALRRHAAVPECLGWALDDLNAAMEANGRFVEPGGWNAVLRRIGAISTQTEIQYWSASRGRWRQLLDDAAALLSDDPAAARGDFLPVELQAGRTLYLRQRANGDDNDVVMRLRIHERTADRLVIGLENAGAVPVHPLVRIDPAATRVALMIEHEGGGRFRYRSLMALDLELGPFLPYLVEKSLRHRSVALFRFVAGIPTDLEPHADGA